MTSTTAQRLLNQLQKTDEFRVYRTKFAILYLCLRIVLIVSGCVIGLPRIGQSQETTGQTSSNLNLLTDTPPGLNVPAKNEVPSSSGLPIISDESIGSPIESSSYSSSDACQDCNPSNSKHYFEVDYLLWWTGRSTIPPLLTTNPVGTPLADAGPIGSPGNRVLVGNEYVGDWAHSGLRLRYGRFLDYGRLSRVELSTWHLFEDVLRVRKNSADTGSATSGTVPIFGRPFFNTETNENDAQILSFPGLVQGDFQFKYGRQFFGVDPLAFFCLASDECRHVEFFTGYRYIRMLDKLSIDESANVPAGGLFGTNTEFRVHDSFRAMNNYHLIPIGLSLTSTRERWIWNIRGDIGLGIVQQTVNIQGRTQVLQDGVITESYDAGLLALGTNSGRHQRTRFAWVPQLSANLHRRVSRRTTFHFGYSIINLNKSVRVAEHIPTSIDPGNIPPVIPGSGPDPKFAFVDHSAWIHGFNFGLKYEF
jgi:hypothetical protein